MSANQAINDKLQGSVATYLRCGEVVNNQIKKGSDLTELWSWVCGPIFGAPYMRSSSAVQAGSLHERQQFVKGFLDATESITANHYRRCESQTPLPATLEQGVV